MLHNQRISAFVEAIWTWYADNKRELPWRDMPIKDPDERAYRVLVSEIMLQQTQVSRVKIVFKEFLERFPQLEDLARASNKDVIMAWRGMGYNSRALRLRDAARIIVHNPPEQGADGPVAGCRLHDGCIPATCNIEPATIFPRSMEELTAIPGVGPYTAGAIRNFAWNLPTPCIDTNIRRILHRTFYGSENADGTWKVDDRTLLKLAEQVLQNAISSSELSTNHYPLTTSRIPQDAANWHAALMDFGSLVQTKNAPRWDACPLTAKGLMKAKRTDPVFHRSGRSRSAASLKKEPGRLVGSAFVPNRIFRGKVVEELRDAEEGLSLSELGRRVCIDWSPAHHEAWLKDIVERLCKDELLTRQGRRYLLRA